MCIVQVAGHMRKLADSVCSIPAERLTPLAIEFVQDLDLQIEIPTCDGPQAPKRDSSCDQHGCTVHEMKTNIQLQFKKSRKTHMLDC